MIRPFTQQDILLAAIFLKKVCDELNRDFDLKSTTTSLQRVLKNGHYMRVYERDGVLLGMAVVIAGPCFTNYRETRAVESLWHTDPALSPLQRARIMVELRQDMEAFARERGHDLYLCPNERGMSKNLAKHLLDHGYTLEESVYLAPKGE